MEKLLHYVWKHRLLPSKVFSTTDGRPVRVLDPGRHNVNQGPDFLDARIELDGIVWAGNIEIHTFSGDWYAHKHHLDPVYNTTILHVVECANRDIYTENSTQVPQVVLSVPLDVQNGYAELLATTDYPRCHKFLPNIPSIKVHAWFDALLVERLELRSQKILSMLRDNCGDWEKTTFVVLARNFGFGLNGDAFEMWAKNIPLSAAAKHRDNLFQIESMFLGMAGLIEKVGDEQLCHRLQTEYKFLQNKFNLSSPPMLLSMWQYLRTRPQNFPHVRIRQLARLFSEGKCGVRALLEYDTINEIELLFIDMGISKGSCRLIIINTIVTLLFAYGIYHSNHEYRLRAINFLEQLPSENNRILRQWQECGLRVGSAFDSQALLQLKKEYCEPTKCLECRFGFEYLSNRMKNDEC
jgi:hypothetical protein